MLKLNSQGIWQTLSIALFSSKVQKSLAAVLWVHASVLGHLKTQSANRRPAIAK